MNPHNSLSHFLKQADASVSESRKAFEEAIVLFKPDGKSYELQGNIKPLDRLAYFHIDLLGQVQRGDVLQRASNTDELWRVCDCNHQRRRLIAELDKLAPTGEVIPKRGNGASSSITNNLEGVTIGNFANQMSDNASQTYNAVPDQTLAEAAQEIQALLDQLSQTYPSETMLQKARFADAAATQAKANPTLRQRLLSAVDAGTIGAIGELLSHPVATFFVDAVKDWEETKPSA